MTREQRNSFPLHQQAIALAAASDVLCQVCVQNKVEAGFCRSDSHMMCDSHILCVTEQLIVTIAKKERTWFPWYYNHFCNCISV